MTESYSLKCMAQPLCTGEPEGSSTPVPEAMKIDQTGKRHNASDIPMAIEIVAGLPMAGSLEHERIKGAPPGSDALTDQATGAEAAIDQANRSSNRFGCLPEQATDQATDQATGSHTLTDQASGSPIPEITKQSRNRKLNVYFVVSKYLSRNPGRTRLNSKEEILQDLVKRYGVKKQVDGLSRKGGVLSRLSNGLGFHGETRKLLEPFALMLSEEEYRQNHNNSVVLEDVLEYLKIQDESMAPRRVYWAVEEYLTKNAAPEPLPNKEKILLDLIKCYNGRDNTDVAYVNDKLNLYATMLSEHLQGKSCSDHTHIINQAWIDLCSPKLVTPTGEQEDSSLEPARPTATHIENSEDGNRKTAMVDEVAQGRSCRSFNPLRMLQRKVKDAENKFEVFLNHGAPTYKTGSNFGE